MVWPPPSTVVMVGGTVRGLVTSPQSAVNVKVVPLVVPAHTAVMSPPEMGAAAVIDPPEIGTALATPPPTAETTGTPIAVIVTTASPTRNLGIPTPRYGRPRQPAWPGTLHRERNTSGDIGASGVRDRSRIDEDDASRATRAPWGERAALPPSVAA